MRDLFERLRRDGEAALKELQTEGITEAVDLDFKAKADPSHPDLNREDKRTLGETLSAFANSAGGLLVFGGVARRGEDGVDKLTSLQPIEGIDRFASEVQTLTGMYLLPRHDGVEQITIASADDPRKGYLAVLVQRSDRRPHQSKAPGDHRYYKRAGDSTFAMEHYDIEDAFKRVSVPLLTPRINVRDAALNPYDQKALMLPIELSLSNEGLALARYPFIHVTASPSAVYDGIERRFAPRWKLTRDEPGDQLTGNADTVIHAGTTQIAGYIMLDGKVGDALTIVGSKLADFSITIDIRFGAELTQVGACSFHLDAETVSPTLRRRGFLPRSGAYG